MIGKILTDVLGLVFNFRSVELRVSSLSLSPTITSASNSQRLVLHPISSCLLGSILFPFLTFSM